VNDTVPRVTPMFWAFRLMVGLGFAMLLLFAVAFWSTLNSACSRRRWLLRWALWMLPRRGSPASWAGSSPSTAASPGPSTACCPPT
jgi:cytochrome bd-type quinol oxidase subunit 1